MKLIPSCPEVHDHMTEYLEHSLPIHKRLGFWMHLVLCHGCDALREALLSLPGLSKRAMAAPADTPPEAKDAFTIAMGKIRCNRKAGE